MSQTSKMKISSTPYYSSSWDGTILLYESCKTSSGPKKQFENWKQSLRSSKIDFYENFQNDHFFCSDLRASNQFSTSIKSIDPLTLPDEIYFSSSSIRKWIQIQIWMYEPRSIFDFKSLASPICCRPRKWRFPWHRITLRVGMGPSCSTSHVKYRVDLKINSKTENKASGARKSNFTKNFKMIIFF